MQMEAHAAPANPVAGFVRAAFDRIARFSFWKRRRELTICETLSLGNRNFLAVIGYQEQRFLIAGTTNSISLLADVTRVPDGEGDCGEGGVPAE